MTIGEILSDTAITTISLEVDDDVARAYLSASPADRRKLELLLKMGLRELRSGSARQLKDVMDEMSRKAAERGLTPGILDSILRDE